VSEALRSVFAELGFDVDLATLEKADKALKGYIGDAQKADKASAKAGAAAKQALTAEERLAKIRASAAEARATHEAKVAFDASDEGKKHAAWQQQIDDETTAKAKADELAKSLSTYGGIVDHVSSRLHTAFGENLARRFPRLGAAAKKAGVDSEGLGKVIVGASAAAVGAMTLATRAAFAFATAFAADAEALRDTARESRVTTTQLQELDHAAAQGGVGVERMRSGLATFGQSLRAAERWGNGTTGMLRRLGIQTRDAGGHIRPTGDLLDEVAVAMEHIESPTRRARVAVQLFGESGRRMLDVLHTGPGGIAALRAELAELGGGVTPEAVEASRQFTQATEKLSRAQDSLRSVLAVALLPALSWVTEKGAKLAGLFARLTNGTHVAQLALAALGVVGAAVASGLVVAWFPVAAPVLATAAAVAAVIAVMDDLITMMEGGDSATGRFIDRMFGVGTTESVVRGVRDLWRETAEAAERAVEAVRSFGESSAPRSHRAKATRPRGRRRAQGAQHGRRARTRRPRPSSAQHSRRSPRRAPLRRRAPSRSVRRCRASRVCRLPYSTSRASPTRSRWRRAWGRSSSSRRETSATATTPSRTMTNDHAHPHRMDGRGGRGRRARDRRHQVARVRTRR
jgi:hypothetical protein